MQSNDFLSGMNSMMVKGMLLNEFSGGALNMALALQSKDFSSALQWIAYLFGYYTGTTIHMKIE